MIYLFLWLNIWACRLRRRSPFGVRFAPCYASRTSVRLYFAPAYGGPSGSSRFCGFVAKYPIVKLPKNNKLPEKQAVERNLKIKMCFKCYFYLHFIYNYYIFAVGSTAKRYERQRTPLARDSGATCAQIFCYLCINVWLWNSYFKTVSSSFNTNF